MSDAENTKSTASKPEKKTGSSSKPSFWKGVKTEFRKIIWPSRETLIRQSSAVVVVSLIVGAIIAIIDRALLYGINFLIK